MGAMGSSCGRCRGARLLGGGGLAETQETYREGGRRDGCKAKQIRLSEEHWIFHGQPAAFVGALLEEFVAVTGRTITLRVPLIEAFIMCDPP